MTFTHIFRFKNPQNCNLYKEIVDRRKKVEGRVNNAKYNKIKTGDIIILDCKPIGLIGCKVTYVNKYVNIETYLRKEGIEKTLGKCAKTIQDGINIYSQYNSNNTITFLNEKYGAGFLGIGIYFIQEYKYHFINLANPYFTQIQEAKISYYPSKFNFYKKGDMVIFTNNNKEGKRFVIDNIDKFDNIDSFLDKNLFYPGITTKEAMLNIILSINNMKHSESIQILYISQFE